MDKLKLRNKAQAKKDEGFHLVHNIPCDDILALLDEVERLYDSIRCEEARFRRELEESERLRADQFVPGVMHCAKCKFQLTKRVLCMGSGTIRAGDNKTEPCPNGCGPLWPVTWKQADDENQEIIGRLCDENRELRAELEVAHIACQLSIAENMQLHGELRALKKPALRLVAGFNTPCIACGQHHAGMAGLPCPSMTPMAGGPADG